MHSSRKRVAASRARRLGLVGTSALVLLATASGGLAASSSPSSSKTTTLTLCSTASSPTARPTSKGHLELRAANPGVKIKVVEQPGQTYFAQLHTAMISKTAPDIADLFAGSYCPRSSRTSRTSSGVGVGLLKSAKGANFYAKQSTLPTGRTGARRRPVLQRVLQQEPVHEGGDHLSPTTWSQLFAACTKLKAKGSCPSVRRPGWWRGDGHRRGPELPRLGPPAQAVERPLQRHRQVRHAHDGEPGRAVAEDLLRPVHQQGRADEPDAAPDVRQGQGCDDRRR